MCLVVKKELKDNLQHVKNNTGCGTGKETCSQNNLFGIL